MAVIDSFFDDFTGGSVDTSNWNIANGWSRVGNAEQELYQTAAATLDGSPQGTLRLTADSFAHLGQSDHTLSGASTTIASGNTGTLSTTPQVLTVDSVANFPTAGGNLTVAHGGTSYYVNYTGVSGSTLTGCTITSGSPLSLATGDSVVFTYPYSSAEIDSRNSFLYGGFYMRAKMPPGNGLWPAFWLVNHGGGPIQEIDILEWLGNQPQNVHNTYIWSYSPHLLSSSSVPVGIDMSTGWHTYGLIWTPVGLTWTFDDVVTKAWSIRDAAKAGTIIPDYPLIMILNLAIGTTGNFAGGVNSATIFPAVYEVDWVKVIPMDRTFLGVPGQRMRTIA